MGTGFGDRNFALAPQPPRNAGHMKGFRILVYLLGFLAACGGGGTKAATTSTSGAACSPSGTILQASADNLKFNEKCLAAPAKTAFTIQFDNREAFFQHNISIYKDSSAADALFRGELIGGPKTITYHVGSLPAGSYFFRCDVHPAQMTGTLVVK